MFSVKSRFCLILFGSACLLLNGAVASAQVKTLVPVYSLLLFDLKAGPDVQLVKDIYPGSSDSWPEELFAWNGRVFFGADDGTNGNEVWMSDGTAGGTTMLKDIHPGPGRSNGYDPPPSGGIGWSRDFTAMGSYVYFAATDGNHPASLWKTDGTEAGTSEVFSVSPEYMTVLNGALIFKGYTGGDVELWKSDGTSGGTAMLKNISQNYDSYPGGMTGFVLFNNELYFDVANTTSNTPPEPCELWKTDGTEAGTVAVKPGTALEPAEELGVCGGYLYFPVYDSGNYSMWRSNGTAAETEQLAGLSFTGSSPRRFTVYNGDLYFSANDGTGWEVWKLNCATGAAAMLKDISPDPNSDSPSELTVYNGFLYFRADHPAYGDELWRTDGTEAGTVLVKDINPGPTGSSLYDLTEFDGLLYFSADDGTNGDELWLSDGTADGISLAKDIYKGPEGSDPYELTPLGNTLLFSASDGASGWELWKLQH